MSGLAWFLAGAVAAVAVLAFAAVIAAVWMMGKIGGSDRW